MIHKSRIIDSQFWRIDPTLERAKNVAAAFLLLLFCIGKSGGGAFMDRSTKTGSMSEAVKDGRMQ